jgi:hypothetical protein
MDRYTIGEKKNEGKDARREEIGIIVNRKRMKQERRKE